MGGMEDGHTRKKDRFLLIVLVVLCVLVVGLAIELIVTLQLKQQSDTYFEQNVQMGAAEISNEIEREVVNKDGEIDMDKADELYKKAIDDYRGDEKLAIVMQYASFVYNNELDAYRALDILKSYENNITEGMTSGLYYEQMASLCNEVGDSEKEAYYQDLAIKVWPDNPGKIINREDGEE